MADKRSLANYSNFGSDYVASIDPRVKAWMKDKSPDEIMRLTEIGLQLEVAEKQLYSFHDYVKDLSQDYYVGVQMNDDSMAMLETRRREASRVFDQIFELYLRWAADSGDLNNDIGYVRAIYFAAEVRAQEIHNKFMDMLERRNNQF